MQTVPLEQFLPEVYLNCTGVSEPAALNALRNASFDICRKSLVWTEALDASSFYAGVPTYELYPPPKTTIVSVVSVLSEGRFLHPVTLDAIDRQNPDWGSAVGMPYGYMRLSTNELVVVPTPDKAAGFTVTVALAPSHDATRVGEVLADAYYETVVHGAVAKLKFVSGHAFSDPSAAAHHYDLFVSGIQSATVNRNRSGGRSQVRVAPRPFI